MKTLERIVIGGLTAVTCSATRVVGQFIPRAPDVPLHPVPPMPPPGSFGGDGGDTSSADGAGGLIVLGVLLGLLFLLFVGIPFVVRKVAGAFKNRRDRRRDRQLAQISADRARREAEANEARQLLWTRIAPRVRAILEARSPKLELKAIDLVMEGMQSEDRGDTASKVPPLDDCRLDSIRVLVDDSEIRKGWLEARVLYDSEVLWASKVKVARSMYWCVLRQGARAGPFTVEELRSVAVTPGMKIRHAEDSSWSEWVNAATEYPELVLAGIVDRGASKAKHYGRG